MHGLFHRSLKRYVVEKTDDAGWETVRDRAGIEPALYLPISYYDDEVFDTILETLSAMTGHPREAIERDFGRMLAQPLLRTFRGYINGEWGLLEVLLSVEDITDELRQEDTETTPPHLTCTQTTGGSGETIVRTTYQSDRDYPALAHGVLEGIVDEYDESAMVRRLDATEKVESVFLVTFEE